MTELDTYRDLPPMQSLVIEVLTARARLGEDHWTFSTRHRPALEALEARGLVNWKAGIVERTCLAWLTEEGRKAALGETYKPPLTFTRDSLADALARLEIKVTLYSPAAMKINAESMADAIIEALGEVGNA